MRTDADYAAELDRADALAPFRARFYLRPDTLYFDGNSLGLLSRDAEAAVLRVLGEWKGLGIDGWLGAPTPWYYLGEELGKLTAPLIGAAPEEVVVTGTTTVNLHNLVATFYRPAGTRRKIVATALDFPSDLYALRSQLALRGADPERDLVLVGSRDGRTIAEEDIVAALTDEVALLLLPSVLYRSGQLFDIAGLSAAARARGISAGYDCCHSVGAVPHRFDEWDVDFACWCNYKYLNNGPGGTAGLYVNRRHFGAAPGLAGWWGSDKARQFDMTAGFLPAPDAGAWQISTVQVLSSAPLHGSLAMFEEAGIARVRAKSLTLTRYLMDLLDATGLTAAPYGYAIGTPREDDRRGGHVAVEHADGARIAKALKARGVVPDFRPPNVVRLAPIALYTSFADVWQVVRHLREIIDNGEHERFAAGRELVA
ncbi:MAG TPA: kynureninase [Thermomicrobiales bacterium]|nr:kynureninase [Thermomicrobiales bacterium]